MVDSSDVYDIKQDRKRENAGLSKPERGTKLRARQCFVELRRQRARKLRAASRVHALSLHRLPQISRPGRLSRRSSALGHFKRDQSEYRRLCLENSAW